MIEAAGGGHVEGDPEFDSRDSGRDDDVPERSPQRFDLTVLLRRSSHGDARASDAVMSALDRELRRIARAQMADERLDHTLQATALVNEAWLRLLPEGQRGYADRVEFLRTAARVMRNVLVDHARARLRDKRGGGREREAFEVAVEHLGTPSLDAEGMLDLHEALGILERIQPRAARVVEMRCLLGLTIGETAGALSVSDGTVENDMRAARAWLAERLRA